MDQTMGILIFFLALYGPFLLALVMPKPKIKDHSLSTLHRLAHKDAERNREA